MLRITVNSVCHAVVYWFFLATCIVDCFNLDLPSKIVHNAPADMWFGYDLDLYKDSDNSWLFVGAPKAQTQQPGVRRGGSVFRCSTTAPKCQEANFDEKGPATALNGSQPIQSDFKSDQLFGATVVASDKGVLACAPHYRKYFAAPQPWGELEEPVGTCFLATDGFTTIEEFSPCRHKHEWGYHRTGYCVAGFSAAISDDDTKLFIGAPGGFYYSGSLIIQSVASQDDVMKTRESPTDFDNIYLGYSTINGDFDGDGKDDVALGAPRGQGDRRLTFPGKVSIYDGNLRNLQNISGDQDGAYFGASLAALDVDGDGLDDLIVGAPQYVHYTKDKNSVTKSEYEVGKVHVFFQGADHSFSKKTAIIGFNVGAKEWSRFGFSLAGAGDLNGDGYGDFIVGAPYDGQNRKGAIYIFHGKEGGVHEEKSQVIYAEDADFQMTTFGFSVAGGRDIDNNDYPDVAVGAYKSNKAVLFKSRPVVSVKGTITLADEGVISLKDTTCPLPGKDAQKVACSRFELCLVYEGKSAPQQLDLEVVITLDAKKGIRSRAFMLSPGDISRMALPKTLYFGEQNCEWYDFYVANNIRDKLSPVIIEANYTTSAARTRSTELKPILDAHVGDSATGQVEFKRECGSDKICIPDLKMVAKLDKTKFVIGTDDLISLDVTVQNLAEDSYGSQYFLTVPPGIEYIEHTFAHKEVPVTCASDYDTLDPSEGYLFSCDVGNPLEKGKDAAFKITFSVAKYGDSTLGQVPFTMSVNSSNPEDVNTLADNDITIYLPLEVEASFVINGKSEPPEFIYDIRPPKTELKFDEDLGQLVTHLYQIRNSGQSRIEDAVVDIYWPSFTSDGSNLLYLINDPFTSAAVNCKIKQNANVNPLSLTVLPREDPQLDDKQVLIRKRRQAVEPTPVNNRKEVSRAFRKLVEELKAEQSHSKVMTAGGSSAGTLARKNIDCSKLNCTQIACDIKDLNQGLSAYISIDARIVVDTLIQEASYEAMISSIAIIKVTKVAYGSAHQLPTQTAVVSTLVSPRPSYVARGLPWWLWLLAILTGLCLLILIILCCWRCGFFKRTRPPKEQALLTQPSQGSEYYGYQGHTTGYAPPALYNESQHGRKL